MIVKDFTFNTLILLSLISFGVFGSLSHVFNLIIILVLALNFFDFKNNFLVEQSAKKLYFAISSVFFVFLIRGIFHSNTWDSIESLSPMLPIPLIGLIILLTNRDGLRISAERLENFAKIAIITTFSIYIVFSKSLAFQFGLTDLFLGRLEIFSGNSIPFSNAVFGVTLFCFANWKNTKIFDKLITVACLILGFWLAGVASGSRGTLLAILISIPVIIWLTTRTLSKFFLIIVIIGSIFGLIYLSSGIAVLGEYYVGRLNNGFDTLLSKSIADYSIKVRMEMWHASINTIRGDAFWGHDISNRFTALSKHLPETFNHKFTHPHNDIFASAIGAGLLGGVLSIVSLLSPVWAALLSSDYTKEKLLLGSLVTLGLLTTANVNTVFFNDITAAWLAFSTFLIWNMNYTENDNRNSTVQ